MGTLSMASIGQYKIKRTSMNYRNRNTLRVLQHRKDICAAIDIPHYGILFIHGLRLFCACCKFAARHPDLSNAHPLGSIFTNKRIRT
jgi:hypothetical protein